MKLLNLFGKDERGATAIIFGLSLLPVMGLAGAAIDYSRATTVQSSLQKGVDGAALQLAQRSKHISNSELQARGELLVAAIADSKSNLEISNVLVEREDDRVRVSADAVVTNAFMGLFGLNTTPVSVEGSATSGSKTIELALVLDNTGSMVSLNRMTSLKTASKNLLLALRDVAPDDETIRVSIVPFDQRVRVDAATYRYANWIRFASTSMQMGWRGYLDDRDQPFDTDASPTLASQAQTLYPAVSQNGQLQTIQPLSSVTLSYSALRNKIDAMQPAGCTNITIGTPWGLATLMPNGPLPGAKPVSTPDLEKIMIVLTDGDNTRSRTVVGPDCNGSVSHLIDPRTRLACDSAKSAGVTVYTVRLTAGNEALLKQCASDDGAGGKLYYNVTHASQLNGVFQEIVNRILSTRLTQ